jgi:hypothetical protein
MYVPLPQQPQRDHIVLAPKLTHKARTLLYDFIMFLQVLAFYIICLTFGTLCVLLDRLLLRGKALDGFVSVFTPIANFRVPKTQAESE